MHSRFVRIGCVLAFSVLISATTCPSDIPGRVPNGSWGGVHIGLVVTDSGATIEYDCGAGTITGPLTLNGSGDFDWPGVNYPGHGGPSRVDVPPDVHPARYTGHATSNQISMTVTIPDIAVPGQTFTAQRGADARLFKCQ